MPFILLLFESGNCELNDVVCKKGLVSIPDRKPSNKPHIALRMYSAVFYTKKLYQNPGIASFLPFVLGTTRISGWRFCIAEYSKSYTRIDEG